MSDLYNFRKGSFLIFVKESEKEHLIIKFIITHGYYLQHH